MFSYLLPPFRSDLWPLTVSLGARRPGDPVRDLHESSVGCSDSPFESSSGLPVESQEVPWNLTLKYPHKPSPKVLFTLSPQMPFRPGRSVTTLKGKKSQNVTLTPPSPPPHRIGWIGPESRPLPTSHGKKHIHLHLPCFSPEA